MPTDLTLCHFRVVKRRSRCKPSPIADAVPTRPPSHTRVRSSKNRTLSGGTNSQLETRLGLEMQCGPPPRLTDPLRARIDRRSSQHYQVHDAIIIIIIIIIANSMINALRSPKNRQLAYVSVLAVVMVEKRGCRR
uniref:Uncharacterized protein n=1 Tax=Anopheles atroparvus TaxID=41427 RepID=A0A182JK58_ANOAO